MPNALQTTNRLLPNPKHKKKAEKKMLRETRGKRDSIKPRLKVVKSGDYKTGIIRK